jgi:hypothetical protein
VDEYLAAKSCSRPLVLLDADADAAALAAYIASVLDGQRSRQLGEPSDMLVVYRFCAHTVVSSALATLVQSVAHQLCYILGVHESWAFAVSQLLWLGALGISVLWVLGLGMTVFGFWVQVLGLGITILGFWV